MISLPPVVAIPLGGALSLRGRRVPRRGTRSLVLLLLLQSARGGGFAVVRLHHRLRLFLGQLRVYNLV